MCLRFIYSHGCHHCTNVTYTLHVVILYPHECNPSTWLLHLHKDVTPQGRYLTRTLPHNIEVTLHIDVTLPHECYPPPYKCYPSTIHMDVTLIYPPQGCYPHVALPMNVTPPHECYRYHPSSTKVLPSI